MRRIITYIKKIILVVLVSSMVITVMQHRQFVTFAADIAQYGPYKGVDITKQNKVVEQVQNTPENEVKQPKREIGSQETKAPYDLLIEAGWKELKGQRTINAKVLEDETTREQRTFMYMGAIHYLDTNNEWQDYETDLVATNNSIFRDNTKVYHQTAGDVDVSIPSTITTTSPIVVGFNAVNLDIVTDTILQDPQVNHNVVTYQTNGNQDTQLINLGEGLMINEKYYYEVPEEITYTYKINEGYQLYTNETKTTVAIVKSEDNQLIGVMEAPKVVDGNKNPYINATIEATPSDEPNTYTVTVGLQNVFSVTPAYPIQVATTTATLPKGSVQIFAINNYKPDVTYGPGGNGLYDDMFLIGDNSVTPLYFPMGIFKGFVTTGVSNWQNYIGQQREITDAKLHIFEFTHEQAMYPDRSEIKVLRIEDDYQGRPNSVTWNKWIASSANLTAISTTWASKYDNDFVHFDITGAISDWYGGAPDYGLLLDTTRDDEGLIFLNHDASNSYVASYGGIDGRPYIEITHKKAEPVDPNLSLDSTTVNVRPFTTNEQGGTLHFQALGFDGVSRPGTIVDIEVLEVNNPQTIVYNSNAFAISGYRQYPYYEPPLYPGIDKAQKYYGLSSNYQDPMRLSSSTLRKDVLYQVRVRANTLNDDGSIKETGKWINGDTFQVYTVKGLDHLPRIMNFYGITDKILLMKDNHMRDELVVENNEMFIRNPKKNQGKPYIGSPLSESDKKNIDGYLMGQGKHCEFGYEPINFNTGNFYYQNSDASFIDYGQEIGIERHYNSLAGGTESIFGRNWEFNWNKQITFLKNGDIFYFDGTGKRIKFSKQGDGSFLAQGGENLTLTREQVGTTSYTEDSGYYDTVDEVPKTTTSEIPVYSYQLLDGEGKVYTFSVNGLLQNIKMDRYEHNLSLTYNEVGNLSKITTPTNKTITLEYNSAGYVNKMTLPDGNTLQYTYDDQGNLVTFKDQEGHSLTYLYENQENQYLMTSYKSRGNQTTIIENTYDANGRVVKQVDAKGDVAKFKYYENRTEITDFNGEKQVIHLDEQKRTTKVENVDGSVKKQTYDDQNNLIDDHPTNASPMHYEYDDRGNIISETRDDGKIKTYVYNELNLVISITDFDGTTVTSEYDSYGNQVAVYFPDGSSKSFTYDEHGQMTSEVDRNGNTKTYTYENGNKTSETDSHGAKSYTYDAMGRIVTEVDANQNTYTFSRNNRGELLSITRPNGMTKYQYNADGEKVWEKDPNGNEKTYTYDDWSRLTSVTDSYGTISYAYDSYGNITKVTDELGNSTSYLYDEGNRKIETIYPDNTKEKYVYDNKGRVIEIIDALGNKTKNEYDDILNQIIKITNPKGQKTKFSYDTLGNVTKIKYPDGTKQTNVYNEQNQIIESTNPAGVKTTYSYDYIGNVLEAITGDQTQKSEYGADDTEIARIDALNQRETISYTATKLIDTVTMKNGSTLQYGYDGEYNITTITDSNGNSTFKTYDGNGNVTSETDALGNTTQYTYTGRNQIATITYPDEGVMQYVYDATGNQIEIIDQLGNVLQKEYDAMHREVLIIDPKGNETIKEYDGKGQLIKVIDALDQETFYSYDEVGNIIEKEEPTGVTTYYQYDAGGRVIETSDTFNRFTKSTYDVMGNLTKVENWKNEVTKNTYDVYGNIITSTDHRGNVTTYEYNANNQVLSQIDSRNSTTAYIRNPIGQPMTTTEDEKVTTDVYNLVGQLIESYDQDGNVTTLTYDAAGNITSITLPNGGTEQKSYTATGLEETITDPNGGVTKNVYDKKSQLLASTDPEGNTVQYEYDENGNQTMVIDPLGYATIYEYDALNRVTEITDKRDTKTTLGYNAWNQVVAKESTTGIEESKYNEKGQLVESVDKNKNVTKYVYNDLDQIIETIQPNGYKEINTYNTYGDVIEVTNNQEDTPSERNTYDTYGQVIKTMDGNGNETAYEYNHKGQISKTTAANGNTIEYTYDTHNRLQTMLDIRGNETNYQYNTLDQVIAVKYPGDKEYTYSYDNVGNLVEEVDPMQAITKYSYNKNNQEVEVINALGITTTTTYDERGDVESTTDGLENVTTYRYDPNGNVTEAIDTKGNTTAYQYDENNQIQTVRDRNDVETSYEYDNNGNMTKMISGNDTTTSFTYNSQNQVSQITNGNNKTESYTYDLKGNIIKETKADSRSIVYQYDALNNMIYQGYDNQEYQYRYNEESQVLEVKAAKDKSLLEYNCFGDLIRYTDSKENMVSYEYDEMGRNVAIIYPDGTKTSYTYNQNDQLLEVQTGDNITKYQYDILGNTTQMILPNGVQTSYEYDANNRLTKLESRQPSGAILTHMEYTYDALGNIETSVEVIDGIKTSKEYTYDNEERLKTSTHTTKTDVKEYTYSYDRAGNKISVEEVINGKKTNTQYTFDDNNALLSQEGEIGTEYRYDAVGNVVEKKYTNGIVENFSYDAKGQLIEVQSTKGKTITYSYDGFGNRTEKTEVTTIDQSNGSSYLEYFQSDGEVNEDYDQRLVIETTDEKLTNLKKTIEDHSQTYDQTCKAQNLDDGKTSIKTIQYINDINQEHTQVLQTKSTTGETIDTYTYGNERISIHDKFETAYYSYDGKGSVIGEITNSHPESLSYQVSYDDYGKTNRKMDDNYGYNGEAHDYNNSQYLRARYYDSNTGTFSQEDSYIGDVKDPLSQNRYSYTRNNPNKYKDPSGHYFIFDDPDWDTISKLHNSHVQSGKMISWDEAEKTYVNSLSTSKKTAYETKMTVMEQKAATTQKSYYQKEIDSWTGDGGDIARKYLNSLLASGMSLEQAFLYAKNVKKLCDELGAKALTALKRHVDNMKANNTEMMDFFSEFGKLGDYSSKEAMTKQLVFLENFGDYNQMSKFLYVLRVMDEQGANDKEQSIAALKKLIPGITDDNAAYIQNAYTYVMWGQMTVEQGNAYAMYGFTMVSLASQMNQLARMIDGMRVPNEIIDDTHSLTSGQSLGNNLDPKLMRELENSGVKYNPDDVVMVTRTADGKLLWLENGSTSSGLKHIVNGHAADFTAKGINDIPGFLNKTLQTTPVEIGMNAKGNYAVYLMGGQKYTVAYGTNGYVVSFYPSK